MVCSVGSGKMTALPRLLDAGTLSHNVPGKEEIGYQKLAAQYVRREIQEVDEANLLDEEDMHIFGLRPMTDPLDLVRCNSCKKPVKASHYAAHAEVCRTVSSKWNVSPELDGPTVNRKPPRKERKKSTQTNKASLVRELRKFETVNSNDIAAIESHAAEDIQIYPSAEAQSNTHLNSISKLNGPLVNPYDINCSQDATEGSSKPLKRTAVENSSDPGIKNLCKTTAEVHPYVPAPLATKIYYSQRNHHLRRAISCMFFEEPSNEVLNFDVSQVHDVPLQTSAPSNFYHEQVANQQAQRDNNYSHPAQKHDHILAAKSDCCMGNSGGIIPSMNTASQPPMNNALPSQYTSNSYSFAGKSGKSLGTLQQGNGTVPVL